MASTTAAPVFTGFGPDAFAWFRGLEADNSRAYFTAHRATYDAAVRGALESMLEELLDDERGGGRVKLFRQHRDTRFSKDKSPYKTTTYGVIGDRLASRAALYAQLSANGLLVATGYYMLARDQLERYRAAVDAEKSGRALQRVVAGVRAAGVEVWDGALKTVPRGYPRDHPRAELLRHKSLVAGRRLAPDAATGAIAREHALALARETWGACAPLTAWLDAHVGDSSEPGASRR